MVRAGPALGPASIAACIISRMSAVVSACVRSATDFFGLRGDGDEDGVLDILRGCRTWLIPLWVIVAVDTFVTDDGSKDKDVEDRKE